MVLIQVTNNPGDEYYVQARVTDNTDTVCTMIGRIHNLRNRVKRLVGGLRELSLYGPMRPPEQRGLTEEQIKAVSEGKSLEATDADPHGIRVGKGPDSKLVEVLEKAASDAEVLVSSKVSTAQRTPMDESKILAALDICRGAVMMAYPMGLPEFDTVRQAIEDKEEIEGTQAARDFFDPSTCSIWFAGKKITRDGELSKYVGKTDRVTIKVKITSERVTNAPAREPPVDAETQRQLMAHWHKKQEEAKRLAEQEDQDSYLNSEWANPKQFKQAAQGIGSIKFR